MSAILGRDYIGMGELRRMLTVESIVNAYRDMQKAESWADWADKNKGPSSLLMDAIKAANDGE